MAMKPCLGCGTLTAQSRCANCTRASYYQAGQWRTMARAFVRAAGGACVRCRSTQYVSAHHVVSRIEGGLDHPSNLEPLCASCHAKEPR